MMRAVLWLATMLFFVAFFTYGYLLWKRAKRRKAGSNGGGTAEEGGRRL